MSEAAGTRYVLFEDPPGQADRTDLGLTFRVDGSLVIDGCYSGPLAERMFGDWDHEFWLTIHAQDAQRFLAAVLRLGFERDERLSFAEIKELCAREGIATSYHSF